MTQTDLAKDLKNISEKDRKQIEQAQEMLGPDPKTMGFVKNIFWGNFHVNLHHFLVGLFLTKPKYFT